MQRREFIGGALWAAVAARAAAGAGPEPSDQTLLVLAQVVVPDRDPAVWRGGEVAERLPEVLSELGSKQKSSVAEAASALDAAAVRSAGRKFAALSLQERTALVKELLAGGGEFGAGFSVVRTAAVNAFYASRTGRQRTGYYDTTQFVGYPEHVRLAETWE